MRSYRNLFNVILAYLTSDEIHPIATELLKQFIRFAEINGGKLFSYDLDGY